MALQSFPKCAEVLAAREVASLNKKEENSKRHMGHFSWSIITRLFASHSAQRLLGRGDSWWERLLSRKGVTRGAEHPHLERGSNTGMGHVHT